MEILKTERGSTFLLLVKITMTTSTSCVLRSVNNKAKTNNKNNTNADSNDSNPKPNMPQLSSPNGLNNSLSLSPCTDNSVKAIANAINSPANNRGAITIIPIVNTTASNSQNFASRTMQTDEDFNIRFVNLVRTHKCLYDKKVPEYRNRDNQEKAWLRISMETKESVIHCKERWRNLRACLSRYIKQQCGSDPQHKPYYLTEHMAFLLPFLKSTRNSLDGNNSLATLYQYSQQQLQQQANSNSTNTGLQIAAESQRKFDEEHQQQLELKHSLSDNEDEETIDAFDPAVTVNLHMQHNNRTSPALSDTASANTLQNFIPDVQLSELRTPDGAQDIAYANNHHMSREGYDAHEPKRIKTECHPNDATSTGNFHLYAGEHADMEFFRSILPDIAGLTPQQKRKLKIGILELIDDVVDRYPAECSSQTTTPSQNNSAKTRRNSSRECRK
uniref:MADF domain-containing protein n=1 Tax=Glossina brevipalpis TaxID=37001 RepID=A0A1A9W000_9MUSC